MNRKILLFVVLALIAATAVIAAIERPRILAERVNFNVTSTTGVGTMTVDTATIRMRDAEVGDYKSLMGLIIMDGPTSTVHGMGLSDTCTLYLYTRFVGEGRKLLDSSAKHIGLPCSLRVVHPYVAGMDTVLKDNFEIKYRLADTMNDTVATFPYYIDYTLRLEAF